MRKNKYKLPFYDETMKDFNELVKLGETIIMKSKNKQTKNPVRAFRLSDYDFEYLRKQSVRHGVSIGQQLRNIINYYRENK